MYRKFITPVYILNMVTQSLFSLVTPIGLMLALSYLLNIRCGVGGWIYAILVTLGAIVGIYSTISFILKTSAAIEALERQHKESKNKESVQNEKD